MGDRLAKLEIGDEVLWEFAKRTSELVESCEFLARLAGDEIGIVMNTVSCEELRRLAERLLSFSSTDRKWTPDQSGRIDRHRNGAGGRH